MLHQDLALDRGCVLRDDISRGGGQTCFPEDKVPLKTTLSIIEISLGFCQAKMTLFKEELFQQAS